MRFAAMTKREKTDASKGKPTPCQNYLAKPPLNLMQGPSMDLASSYSVAYSFPILVSQLVQNHVPKLLLLLLIIIMNNNTHLSTTKNIY